MKDNYQTCLMLLVGSNDFSWKIFIFMLYFDWILIVGGTHGIFHAFNR